MTQSTDVVIVGAGASGLRIAGLLERTGINFVVLESRDRVGGRLLTVDPGIDLGATWFWQNEVDVLDVISEYDLMTFPQHVAGNMMFQVPGNTQQLNGNPLDQNAWRISGGMQSLTSALASAIPAELIKLSTEVTDLEFGKEVRVTTNRGDWLAKHVVLAIPPATALANIAFSPQLPTDLANVARQTPVWMGAITKVVAIYDSPFWRSQGLAGSAMSHVGPLREIHDISDESATFGALFGFSRESVSTEAITEQLSAIFGPEARRPNLLVMKDWSKSRSTSPNDVHTLNDYKHFGSQVLRDSYFDGQLYFSSTETALDAPGHVQGALSAAKRTAISISRATCQI